MDIGQAVNGDTAGRLQALTSPFQMQMEYQIIRTEAGYVAVSVEIIEAVVEIIREKNSLYLGLTQNMLGPIRSLHGVRGSIEDLFPMFSDD